ncbi:MAG: ribosome silencing factor [Lentimicrobiaceae bacterium]|jgi:ribosome-associated protein|nr:ribosome silencing factor [Lentimicrobiaceae bacterium]
MPITETEALVQIAIRGIQEKKGKGIISLNLTGIKNAICDYFIICNANSRPQIEAIVNNVEKELRETAGVKPWFIEGRENAQWVLMDYIDVVIHIFTDDARAYYDLENLWADAGMKKYSSE